MIRTNKAYMVNGMKHKIHASIYNRRVHGRGESKFFVMCLTDAYRPVYSGSLAECRRWMESRCATEV